MLPSRRSPYTALRCRGCLRLTSQCGRLCGLEERLKERKASVPFLNTARKVENRTICRAKVLLLRTKCRHCNMHCGCSVACIRLGFELLRKYYAIISSGCDHDFVTGQTLLCHSGSEGYAHIRIIRVQHIALFVLSPSSSLSCLLINMKSSISRIHRGSRQISNTCLLPSDEFVYHIRSWASLMP